MDRYQSVSWWLGIHVLEHFAVTFLNQTHSLDCIAIIFGLSPFPPHHNFPLHMKSKPFFPLPCPLALSQFHPVLFFPYYFLSVIPSLPLVSIIISIALINKVVPYFNLKKLRLQSNYATGMVNLKVHLFQRF